jgi:hypothetical protein
MGNGVLLVVKETNESIQNKFNNKVFKASCPGYFAFGSKYIYMLNGYEKNNPVYNYSFCYLFLRKRIISVPL